MRENIVCVLVAVLASSQLATWVLWPKPRSFGVIDMQALIADRAQYLAKSGKINSHQIHELAEHLKEELYDFAQTEGIILLSKGSVAGGKLTDYTGQFLTEE